MTAVPQLRTTGVIAKMLDAPLHRVVHILATRPHIKPAARAGILRLFDSEAIEKIRHELEVIDAIRQFSNTGESA
ncbi:hypothetical protein [Blastopirellula retiformator]|uniref:Uncharacterized protein n=1 Tax=Blastopirellula retiformator TaxID=2527970 RepID=A0A5C5UWX0_9BACT|nr:hypothetical protein [Blastopirellula retiformator]TWT30133.1 hypothetical protein Enr8_47920 [Blastopirellula retiformator]